MIYKPPFIITPKILKLSQNVSQEIGRISGSKLDASPIRLRKLNSIKTIQASLAIEGNTLSVEQVSHVFDGKRVFGPKKDIIEVENAIKVYSNLNELNPLRVDDLLRAHKVLTDKLTSENGKWRTGGVGIYKGEELSHMPPPAKRVPALMDYLFQYLEKDNELTWLLKACIFHYELEFIHPFADGNGRMGRLWQQLLLMKESHIFEFITVEELIKSNQESYYKVLSDCDMAGESTKFVEFSLKIILESLTSYETTAQFSIKTFEDRLEYASSSIGNEWFSRKSYMSVHKELSSASASRDLNQGVGKNILKKKGDKNQTLYKFTTAFLR